MRGPQADLSPTFGAPAMPAPWQATQAVSYAAVPLAGTAAAAVGGPALSILSEELSWPATATRATGCKRSTTLSMYFGSLVICAPWLIAPMCRANASRPMVTANKMPRTRLKLLKKWESCLLMGAKYISVGILVNWRARLDSNQRPAASEAATLSS